MSDWVCLECGRSFSHWWRLYRSGLCKACYERRRRQRHRHKERACEVCNVAFTTTRRDSRFCSNACRQSAYRSRTTTTTTKSEAPAAGQGCEGKRKDSPPCRAHRSRNAILSEAAE
jgi:hypothetical protein